MVLNSTEKKAEVHACRAGAGGLQARRLWLDSRRSRRRQSWQEPVRDGAAQPSRQETRDSHGAVPALAPGPVSSPWVLIIQRRATHPGSRLRRAVEPRPLFWAAGSRASETRRGPRPASRVGLTAPLLLRSERLVLLLSDGPREGEMDIFFPRGSGSPLLVFQHARPVYF